MKDTAQHNADVIKGRRKAEAMLADAMADYEADCGEAADEVWHDLVVATAQAILQEDWPLKEEVAREFCRTQVGSIPLDLEPQLGKKDWIQ
jgi:hypothetical protein